MLPPPDGLRELFGVNEAHRSYREDRVPWAPATLVVAVEEARRRGAEPVPPGARSLGPDRTEDRGLGIAVLAMGRMPRGRDAVQTDWGSVTTRVRSR